MRRGNRRQAIYSALFADSGMNQKVVSFLAHHQNKHRQVRHFSPRDVLESHHAPDKITMGRYEAE